MRIFTNYFLTPGPDSPPISDDEESKGSALLKLLNDAIEECDINEDSDLCDYFEDGDEGDNQEDEDEEEEDDDVVEVVVQDIKPEPQQQSDITPVVTRPYFNAVSDHCYHKDKNASMRMINLGIETPSDSGEFSVLYLVVSWSRLCFVRIVEFELGSLHLKPSIMPSDHIFSALIDFDIGTSLCIAFWS